MILSQPSIYFLGVRIDEPINTLTDIVISVICFAALFLLMKRKVSSLTQVYFRMYFVLLGLATLLGGLFGHGFLYIFSVGWKLPGWIVSMLSVAFIERSSIEYVRPLIHPRIGKLFLALNLVELLTVMSITIYTLDFKWVEFHSGYGLLAVVLPFHMYNYHKTHEQGSAWILIGVLFASLAALIFMNQFSLHIWFNYVDISHCLLAVAVGFFYRGALVLRPRYKK